MNTWVIPFKTGLVLVALVCWWFRRTRFAPRSGLLGAQLAIAFIVETYGQYTSLHHQANLWWYDLYVPVEFSLLLAYIHGQLSRPWQRFAIWPAWLLLAVAYAFDLRANYPDGFVSGAYILGSLVLVGALFALVYDLALRMEPLPKQPLFWAHLGMVLFFAGMVPVLGLWNQLTNESAVEVSDLYVANHVLFILRYGGIVVACAVRVPSPSG